MDFHGENAERSGLDREKANRVAERAIAPQRLADIRRRIFDHAYDSPSMIELVARRLLESGDLDDRHR